MSREADLIPIDAPETTDLISAVLGELSAFDETYGYHADGVDLQTAILPQGWRDRLVAIDNPNTNGYVGLCVEIHDLLISKYVANREKDREFCSAVAGAGLVDRGLLLERLATVPLDPTVVEHIERLIDADFALSSAR